MFAIWRKELADYLNSSRFFILFLLAVCLSALALYSASSGIRSSGDQGFLFLKLYTTELQSLPQNTQALPLSFLFNYVNFIPLVFIPLLGIVLGFDAVNRERNSGTLSRIMSQPVYRDSVINGKFLASLFVLTVMTHSASSLSAATDLK